MAFGFFGTFTTAQLDLLRTFSKYQEQDLKKRAEWLRAELGRVGDFTTLHDDDDVYPTEFSATPGSYADKLLTAYKILGGDPIRDMLLRTSDKAVFKKRGSDPAENPGDPTAGYATEFSNGRKDRGNLRFDASVGTKVNRLKAWQLEVVKHKREHLEYKIKRALDLSSELKSEIAVLESMMAEDDGIVSLNEQNQVVRTGGVDFLHTEIYAEASLPGSLGVIDSPDQHGLAIGPVADTAVQSDIDTADARSLRGLDTVREPA